MLDSPDAGFATKSDLAYTRVRALILTGELAPGAVLPQASLAQTIGISTTPLREALRRLKQEGLVELDAHKDARVRPLDATEARDLLELRRSLDPLAASLAAQRRTDADVDGVRAALDGLEALTTSPSLGQLESHHRFHAAIHRASHNALLIDVLDGLWVKTDRYRRHGLETGRSETIGDIFHCVERIVGPCKLPRCGLKCAIARGICGRERASLNRRFIGLLCESSPRTSAVRQLRPSLGRQLGLESPDA